MYVPGLIDYFVLVRWPPCKQTLVSFVVLSVVPWVRKIGWVEFQREKEDVVDFRGDVRHLGIANPVARLVLGRSRNQSTKECDRH